MIVATHCRRDPKVIIVEGMTDNPLNEQVRISKEYLTMCRSGIVFKDVEADVAAFLHRNRLHLWLEQKEEIARAIRCLEGDPCWDKPETEDEVVPPPYPSKVASATFSEFYL